MKRIVCLLLIFSCMTWSSCSEKEGCTDRDACNYDSDAEKSDDSCYYICLSEAEKQEVKDFVESALDYMDTHGVQDALDTYSDHNGIFVDGEKYIFAITTSGVNLAHGADSSLIGQDLYELQDENGKYLVQEMISISNTRGSGWLWYMWENPDTKEVERKHSYITTTRDTIMLGSGAY